MNVLDLFSGIGGFSLGLERAGMRTVAFCEIEPYCQAVLRKHWPNVPIFGDIRKLTADTLRTWGISVDVICGGFPCQDISVAGKGAGIDGERSGLWSEYARIIGEIRPGYVIVENVAALLARGLDRVLRDMATLGYHAEWHCIPASAVGAPHRRDRIWIMAYAQGIAQRAGLCACEPGRLGRGRSGDGSSPNNVSHAKRELIRQQPGRRDGSGRPGTSQPSFDGAPRRMADADAGGCSVCGQPQALSDRLLDGRDLGRREAWHSESGICRVADGVPNRVDRLRSLGNSVVPQIPEIIGRSIMKASMVTSQHHSTPGE